MVCSNCNQSVVDSAKFCPKCGQPAVKEPPSVNPKEAATERMVINEPQPEADPLVGRLLDSKYQLCERLGAGGMGAVYRAKRTHIGDEVAVKVLHQKLVTDAEAIERFRREARAAAVLRHPNIVTIYDYGEPGVDSPAFIVMELVNGEPLGSILEREGRIEQSRAVQMMQEICSGVAAAHRSEIVHRDLKPDNVIVLPAGADRPRETVKVVDFGIAKLRDAASEVRLTQTGTVIGTPFYMSPEQCRGETLDSRSDVYSLSAMMYEMLLGQPPFTAASITGVIAKHLTETPPPFPGALKIKTELESVVMRGLFKDSAMRHNDAAEFGRALQTAIEASPVGARSAGGYDPDRQTSQSAGTERSIGTGANTLRAPIVAHSVANPPRKSSWSIVFVSAAAFVVLLAAGAGVYTFVLRDNNASEASQARSDQPSGEPARTAAPRAAAQPMTPPASAGSPNVNRGIPEAELPSTGANTNASTKPEPLPQNSIEYAEAKVVSGSALVERDIQGLTGFDLRVLRNAVYARHGRVFDTPALQRYFESRPWYSPRRDYSDSMLTANDRANAALIQSVEMKDRPQRTRH